MPHKKPTNGRKTRIKGSEQLSLWPNFAPVTAYDLAVWLFGVARVPPDSRGLAAHVNAFDFLNKINHFKANDWQRWLEIEAKATKEAARWSGGLHGHAALKLAADGLRPTLAQAVAIAAIRHRHL